jgi:uncharacterized protein (DUF2147 family)
MSARLLAFCASVVMVAGVARPLMAQSLAEVAREEQQRRQAIKKPAKVLTNDDLQPVPAIGDDTGSQSDASGEAAKGSAEDTSKDGQTKDATADGTKDASKDGAAADQTAKAKEDEPVKDQKYWSDRYTSLQTKLERDRTYATALQTRIDSLTTDFVNRDDPAERASIESDRQKTIDELGRLNKEIQDTEKAATDLQEEARRAGVPPGWLR